MTLFANLKVRWLLWRARVIDKLNRLDAIDHVPVGVTLEDVVALYGQPEEANPCDDNPEATSYEFTVSPFHEASVTVWNAVVHQIVYWSSHADPRNDLAWMLETYGDGVGWSVMTEGYSYRRKDGNYFLWCSAMPVIGVASAAFTQAKAEVRRQRREARTSTEAKGPN